MKLFLVIFITILLVGCETTNTTVTEQEVPIYGGYYHPMPVHIWKLDQPQQINNTNHIMLIWNNDNVITSYINVSNIVVEIWSSFNLTDWTLKDTVPVTQTNYVVSMLADKEFFKIRNRDTRYNIYSAWSN
jgi:hypothetical protein